VSAAAFFDVDETLITGKSMFGFLEYWLALDGDDGTRYRKAADALFDMARRGLPRETGNRAYYANFSGSPASDVLAAGRSWYAAYRERETAFVTSSLAALAAHKADGHRIVLVSGSFEACLTPIAEDLGADAVLCSEPLSRGDGTYTGSVRRSMIGEAKAEAVASAIEEAGLDPADCFAYGDHSSDLAMLAAVGHPVVVGDDPVLTAHAAERGWRVLPATGGRRGEA